MVKGFKLLLTLTLAFGITSFSNVQENSVVNAAIDATNVDTYYSSLYDSNGNIKYTGDTLLSKLNELISTDTTNKGYDDLDDVYKTTDIDPNNPDKVILYYTGESRSYNFSGFSGTINREHVWPQSHFGASVERQTSPFSDAHHVRPCDSSLNSSRGNSYFDELSKGTTDDFGNMWSGGIFYPSEAYRGDAARICFYVAARYTNLSFVDDASSGDTGQNLEMGNLSALLKWNEEYGVSASEIRRNNAVAAIQNNRNPFIDHPEFAEYIWGDGSYDSGNKDITYSVIYKSMGGSEVATQEVIVNDCATKPTDPTKAGYIFEGWYLDSACTIPYDFSNKVTNSVILYAKWIPESVEVVTELEIMLTSSENGFSNGQKITSVEKNPVELTFSKGNGSNDPAYYDAGDAIRLYAKNTLNVSSTIPMKSLTFTFSSGGDSNEITVNKGAFSSPTWSASDEATTSITFTVGGTKGHRRINKIYIEFFESEKEVDLSSANIETALSFSYTNSGSEMITFVGKHSRLNESSSLTDKNGCSYSNTAGSSSDLASFGIKTAEKFYLAAETNNLDNHILKFGTGSAAGSMTFLNVNYNAAKISFKASGWNGSTVITLVNATCNGSETITLTTTYSQYEINVINPTLDVSLSSTSSEKRFFLGDIAFPGTETYSFDNFLMRYKVNIDKDVFDSIGGVSYGALINAKENNPSYSNMTVIDFDNKYTQANNYLNIEISSNQIVENESTYTLSAALKGIPNTDLEKEVVTVFYIKTATNVYFTNSKTYSVSSLVDEYLTKHSSILTEEEIKILNALDASIN